MEIHIKTIPHDQQRYETCGDWWFQPNGDMEIRVSEMGSRTYEFLIALHEMVEALLCDEQDIAEEVVSIFDRAFEYVRVRFPLIIGDQEPGDMVSAPYHKQHIKASQVEQFAAGVMGINFQTYENMVNKLIKPSNE